MEKRSKALEKQAQTEMEIDMEEQRQKPGVEDVDDDTEGFHLPTAEEREDEAKNGVDLNDVQKRMRACARILNNFSKLAEPGR